MKEYDSPEFEFIQLSLTNTICTQSITDPVEDHGEEHNFEDGWG